jgi:parvulin-like peptidyl-prolyl isomerase
MKKSLVFFVCMVGCLGCSGLQAKRYTIDTIKVVVYGEEATDIITQSEVERPGLDGAVRSLDTMIFERLVFQYAGKYGILPKEDEVDRYLKAIQRENNLTLDQLKGVFTAAGYTYEEGRKQFSVIATVNKVLDYRIRSRLIVPEKDVRAYYEEHPEYEEASYLVRRTLVPFYTIKTEKELEMALARMVKDETLLTEFSWSDPFTIEVNDLAEDKQFITQMKIGEVSEPVALADGFELFYLKDKKERRLKSFEERYKDIADILRQPRYTALMSEYKSDLLNAASILYLD